MLACYVYGLQVRPETVSPPCNAAEMKIKRLKALERAREAKAKRKSSTCSRSSDINVNEIKSLHFIVTLLNYCAGSATKKCIGDSSGIIVIMIDCLT